MITYNILPHISGDTWLGIPLITIQKNGSAVDLTDALVKMQVRSAYDGPVFLELDQDNGIIILDPSTSGNIIIPPLIVDIPTGNYVYDIKVIFNDGTVKTEVGGNWYILPHATK